MAIGTSKSGVLGSGSVPAGCITINSTTVWVAPAGVRKVSVYGHGSSGTSGSSGNPGNPGEGGGGGGGGSTYRTQSQHCPTYGHSGSTNTGTYGSSGGNAGRSTYFNPGVNCGFNSVLLNSPQHWGAAGNPSANSGSTGNPGSAGNAGSAGSAGSSSSALGVTFPGGNAGNGGNSGSGGTAGTGGTGGHGAHNSYYQGGPAGQQYHTTGLGGLAGQGFNGNWNHVMLQFGTGYFSGLSNGPGAGSPFWPCLGYNTTNKGQNGGQNYFNPGNYGWADAKFYSIGLVRYGTIGNGGCGYVDRSVWNQGSKYSGAYSSCLLGGPGGCGAGNQRVNPASGYLGSGNQGTRLTNGGVGGRGGAVTFSYYQYPNTLTQAGYHNNYMTQNAHVGSGQMANESPLNTGGGGGGGAAGAVAIFSHSMPNTYCEGFFNAGGGGGGAGMGQKGIAGGGGGSGGSASPSTSNCVSVSAGGSYPVTVAPGASVKISWKSQ